jgi:hypothetical protein
MNVYIRCCARGLKDLGERDCLDFHGGTCMSSAEQDDIAVCNNPRLAERKPASLPITFLILI